MKASVTATDTKANAKTGAKTAKATTKTSAKTATKAKTGTKTSRSRAAQKTSPGITQDRLHQLIAEEAYLRAEQRGFANGDPVSDWLAAEQKITHRLTQGLEPQGQD